MSIENPQAVVILGMHRSGTSAVAGTVARLGLALPRTPLPASHDNPSGFYEPQPVVHANYLILRAAGCAWNLCLMFEPEQLDRLLLAGDRQHILELFRHEYDRGVSFVLKDPRLCLTLPAWLPALRENGAAIRVLIVVRHPVEVVHSIVARNRRPEGETAAHWLHHLLEAERQSRAFPRAVVLYDELMRDWRGCLTRAAEQADIAWPRPVAQAAPDIESFLAPTRRSYRFAHHAASIGPSPVGEMVEGAWGEFQGLVGDPHDAAALARLDRMHARFADWRHQFFPPGTAVVFDP